MQETETIDHLKWILAVKKVQTSAKHRSNVTDAHTGYNVHWEALNEAAFISGDQFHEPHALVVRL